MGNIEDNMFQILLFVVFFSYHISGKRLNIRVKYTQKYKKCNPSTFKNLLKKCLLQEKNRKARRGVFKHTMNRFPIFDAAKDTFSTNLKDFPPRTLKESVYTALCFFDIFDQPLTLDELYDSLMGTQPSKEELIHFLSQQENIQKKEGFYFLEGREKNLETRKNRTQTIQKFQKKVRRFLPFIQLVPYVRMVAVCNTLAMETANEQSDIDLFIITAPGKIFLARTLTTILFSLLGIRRHGKKIAGRFCLSFYMNENHLDLQKIMKNQNDIYLLYWFRSLQPIYGKSMYKKFIHTNQWIVEKYFSINKTWPIEKRLRTNKLFNGLALFWEWILDHTFAHSLEKKLQEKHLKRHRKNLQKLGPESSVVVNETMLKFHNVDRREEFSQKFEEKIAFFLSNP